MIGPEQVAAGVMAAFNRSPARVRLDGGLHYGRVPESAAAPYGRLGVVMSRHTRLSNRYLRMFDIRVEIWGDTGPIDLGPPRASIEAAVLALKVPEAIKVVDVKPADTDLQVVGEVRNAKDVCLLSLGWQALIEGN